MQSISESPRGLKPRPPEAVVDFFRAFALFNFLSLQETRSNKYKKEKSEVTDINKLDARNLNRF